MNLFLVLFCVISPTFGILNIKRPQQLREVYNVDSGFQTGGNYRPARAPETLLGTQTPYIGNGEFQEGENRPYFRPKKCPQCQCSTKDTYICGSNLKIYRSQCSFSCAQMCDPGQEIVFIQYSM
ncbi:unnamed protein product [Allacma fusca]|uniref:Kazal-like domain-containing protein n=1 Tax=Allacma fusca TaxID=39272 RepID=A0A8J2PFP3_9HEXA|nr:unnamed protein product [Allacma fusca]